MGEQIESIRVTREFTFEMAHHLPGHDGLCINIHDHSCRLSLTIREIPLNAPSNPKDGMLIDFGNLKSIVQGAIIKKLDHGLVLRNRPESQEVKRALLKISVKKVLLLPDQPTYENVLLLIKNKLIEGFPDNLALTALELKETASTIAIWQHDDN